MFGGAERGPPDRRVRGRERGSEAPDQRRIPAWPNIRGVLSLDGGSGASSGVANLAGRPASVRCDRTSGEARAGRASRPQVDRPTGGARLVIGGRHREAGTGRRFRRSHGSGRPSQRHSFSSQDLGVSTKGSASKPSRDPPEPPEPPSCPHPGRHGGGSAPGRTVRADSGHALHPSAHFLGSNTGRPRSRSTERRGWCTLRRPFARGRAHVYRRLPSGPAVTRIERASLPGHRLRARDVRAEASAGGR